MPQSPHRLRNDLKCVEWDVKPYTTNQPCICVEYFCLQKRVRGAWNVFTVVWSVVRTSVRPSVIIGCAWRNFSLLSAGISKQLGTNVRHESGHCWKRLSALRSKVVVLTKPVDQQWKRQHFDGVMSRLTCLIWSSMATVICVTIGQ